MIKTIMKWHILLISIVIAMNIVSSCEKNEEKIDHSIEIEPSSSINLNQELSALQKVASSITFTTTEAWSSTIKYSSQATKVDQEWIKITPEKGVAGGTYTIKIEATQNDIDSDRMATITIISGDKNVEIIVKQKAFTKIATDVTYLPKKVLIKQYADKDFQTQIPLDGNFDWELGKDYKIEARYREYSHDGKLTKVEIKLHENNEVANIEPIQKMLYKYDIDNTVVSDFFENNKRDFSVTFCYNSQNLLSEVSTDYGYNLDFEYSNGSEVSTSRRKSKYGADTYTYNWIDENCVRVFENGESRINMTYYTELLDPLYGVFPDIDREKKEYSFGSINNVFVAIKSKKLIKKKEILYDGEIGEEYTYSYEFDELGRIKVMYVVMSATYYNEVYYNKYEYYY